MKTFKQFLSEEYFEQTLNEEFELLSEHEFERNEINPHLHLYHHSGEVDGNHVKVTFLHDGSGKHETDFFVNDHYSHERSHKQGSNTHTNHKILHHVNKVVNSFIHHHKPKVLSMIASDTNHQKSEEKRDIYKKFAHHLAQKHKGKAVFNFDPHTGMGGSEVHFNH